MVTRLIKPTRVNWACLDGPVFHYTDLTQEQAGQLARLPGARVRRTRRGHNVTVPAFAAVRADAPTQSVLHAVRREAMSAAEHPGLDMVPATDRGIWALDLATMMITADRSAREIYGMPPVGTPISLDNVLLRVPEPHRQEIMDRIELAMRGAPYSTSYEVRLMDGTTRRVGSVASLVRAHDGTPTALVGVIQVQHVTA